jgi:hypothetical protein
MASFIVIYRDAIARCFAAAFNLVLLIECVVVLTSSLAHKLSRSLVLFVTHIMLSVHLLVLTKIGAFLLVHCSIRFLYSPQPSSINV